MVYSTLKPAARLSVPIATLCLIMTLSAKVGFLCLLCPGSCMSYFVSPPAIAAAITRPGVFTGHCLSCPVQDTILCGVVGEVVVAMELAIHSPLVDKLLYSLFCFFHRLHVVPDPLFLKEIKNHSLHNVRGCQIPCTWSYRQL